MSMTAKVAKEERRQQMGRAENVMARLKVFEKIENKATDEVGWIALAFSVTRGKAQRMIDEARKLTAKETACR